ncbi:GH25 family lysozyme [Leifsonia poae]|uniref:lysozyme n=1 Tax=Leifsonia poae TaxID=110933 RepID=A0A9W6HC93_9MICO|nr:GH25 family lysozyme [Leifsonia poae]GLJ77885.1 hypothetical protein GCM10017584_34590 [Leifsonia poae]
MSVLLRTLTTMTVTAALVATGALAATADTPTVPAGTDAQPTLAQMNAAGDHTMGSTVPGDDPASTAPRAFSGAAVQPLAATQPPGVQGLDVSGWQKLAMADWTRVWANGGRFAYVKATESTDFTSSQFTEQYNDSYRAGLVRGAYHFATPNTSSGAAQANFFVAHGGGWVNDGRTLPPLLDIEYNPYGATCYGKTAAQMVAWIRDFSNTVRARTGRLPAIYSTTDWWTRCTGNNGGFGGNPLVIARYPNNIASGAGTLPAGWSRYTMWQYANHGVFPGDQDVFNGTVAQLLALTRSGSTAIALDSPIVGVGDFNGDRKPDLIARRGDGSLWFYAGTGTVTSTSGGYAPGRQIGTGWNVYDAIIGVGDYNGDRRADLLGRRPDGSLWFYPGTGTVGSGSPGYGAGVRIDAGWGAFTQITAPGDFNADGRADLLARKSDGTLWFFAGTGIADTSHSGHAAPVQIGTGWQVYSQLLGIGDQNRDGKPDLAGFRSDGSLYLYAGGRGGAGTPWYGTAQKMPVSGLSRSDTLSAPGDFNGDGITDLLARGFDGALRLIPGYPVGASGYQAAVAAGTGWTTDSVALDAGDFNLDGWSDIVTKRTDGSLVLHPGSGPARYGTALRIGTGWNVYSTLIAPGDLNHDGKVDLLGVRSSGTLWYYAGTASFGGGATGYRPAVQLGPGWNAYTRIVAGDFNGDGRPDLVGVRSNGTLWFHAGTAQAASAAPVFRAGVQVGTGWAAFNTLVSTGDLDRDGKPDLVGRRADGSLWFYHGTGRMGSSSGYSAAVRIGTGWNVYRSILGAHDANRDGRTDLLGVRSNGTVWFYAGTGGTGVPRFGYGSSVRIGASWNVYQ